MDATMTTPEAEVALDPDALPSVEPPPIPQLPAGASRDPGRPGRVDCRP